MWLVMYVVLYSISLQNSTSKMKIRGEMLCILWEMSWLERVPTWKDAEEEAKASDTHNLGRF
jgi:hypothetical protein